MITRSLSRLLRPPIRSRRPPKPCSGAAAQGYLPPLRRGQLPGSGTCSAGHKPALPPGTSGEGNGGEQLLVVYYQRQQPDERVERELQRREQQQLEQQEQHAVRASGAWRLVVGPDVLKSPSPVLPKCSTGEGD